MPESSGRARSRGFRSVFPAATILLAGLAATPAAAAPREDSYILSLGNSTTISNASIEESVQFRGKRATDFLWARRAGKAYLIEGPAALKEARAFFAPLRALEPEREDLRRREEALDGKEQELDQQEEEIDRRMDVDSEDHDEDDDAIPRIAPVSATERQELERQMSAIRSRQREIASANREIERVERDLDAREEEIERKAESKLWSLIDGAVKSGVAKPI